MIKVLVIDDSALMRKLLGRVLGDVTEFEVYFARSGAEGLEKLAALIPMSSRSIFICPAWTAWPASTGS